MNIERVVYFLLMVLDGWVSLIGLMVWGIERQVRGSDRHQGVEFLKSPECSRALESLFFTPGDQLSIVCLEVLWTSLLGSRPELVQWCWWCGDSMLKLLGSERTGTGMRVGLHFCWAGTPPPVCVCVQMAGSGGRLCGSRLPQPSHHV